MVHSTYEEAYRTRAVAEYDLAPDNLERELERVLAVAATRWRTPRATFTVVEGDRQFFPARLGTEHAETTRSASLCALVVETGQMLLAPDTRADPRLRRHAAVVGPPFIRFYAGVPLRPVAHGAPIGALCVLDTAPRTEIADADVALLRDLSFVVLAKLAERRTRASVRRAQVRTAA